jgi:PBP1b-binding outer membrane lipoprotein LpoB
MRKTNNKMNRATMHIYRLGLIAILFLVGCKQQSGQGEEEIQKPKLSPLEAYISAPDDAFEYKSIDRVKGEGFTYYVIRMVSQRWVNHRRSGGSSLVALAYHNRSGWRQIQ